MFFIGPVLQPDQMGLPDVDGIAHQWNLPYARTGLGRTILYVQVRDGLLSADAVRSGTNYVGLSSSAVVADSWPVVAAAIVFAAVALALALLSRNRHGGGTASRLRIGGNAAIVVGLLGITLVECGLMPTTLVLVAMAAFVAFLCAAR